MSRLNSELEHFRTRVGVHLQVNHKLSSQQYKSANVTYDELLTAWSAGVTAKDVAKSLAQWCFRLN